jgi:hypothetical protein
MKQTNVELKKGDRIWVQEYDFFGDPLRLRFAEVLGVVRLPTDNAPIITVHYLDGNRAFETVPMNRVKEYCKQEEF